jgi:hypothetical protein
MLLSEGQMSDYRGAALMLKALPKAKAMLADKGYDADWFRKALAEPRLGGASASPSDRCRWARASHPYRIPVGNAVLCITAKFDGQCPLWVSSAGVDQRKVVAHVRFCSDCRHDDAQHSHVFGLFVRFT